MIKIKTAAIYARRSRIVETGNSIEAQVQICSAYLNNLGISNTIIYSDEGFSGKDTARPNFTRLLKDAQSKKFDVLICYKLDRMSRNIGDFSNLINLLESYNISFISVVEQFDTTNAMGKAMMYICSVFSQLERETISKRVADNMYNRAEHGYWLGGKAPFGYTNIRETHTDSSGKNRTFAKLIPDENEILVAKLLLDKYLELKSLSKLEKFTLQNNIKTRQNKDWSKSSLSYFINNPTYVKSDEKVIEYFNSINIPTYGVPDGSSGFVVYRKRKGKNGQCRNSDEWIYAISNHEGIIDSESWLKIQSLAKLNKLRAPNMGCSQVALLSGLIQCEICGTHMRVTYGKPTKTNSRGKHYYSCIMKHSSGGSRCNNKNVDGIAIDSLITTKLKELSIDKGTLITKLKEYKHSLENSSENVLHLTLQKEISKHKEQINNTLNSISLTTDDTVVKALLDKISTLKDEESKLNASLEELNLELKKQDCLIENCTNLIDKLKNFSELIDSFNIENKKKLVSSIIDRVFVNGTTGAVKIKFKDFNKK